MPRKSYNRKLTDLDVIRLFDTGKYKLDRDEWRILKKNGEPVFTYKGSRQGDYDWCRLYEQPLHRAMAVHVIIWIVTNRAEVPKGWQVHHDDECHTNNNPLNLFCLHPSDHTKVHTLRKLGRRLSGLVVQEEEVPF